MTVAHWEPIESACVGGRRYERPRQAVILAGGRGERMRPLTDRMPKPMIPVHGRPFLEYQICQLRDEGFERVLLLLGYLPDAIRDYFGDGARWNLRIEYSTTAPEDLTCRRVAVARDLIDPCFLLLYCDNYWPMRMDRLWKRFTEARMPAQITVYRNADRYSRGGVRYDEDGYVTKFDRERSSDGDDGVEISYAIVTEQALDLLPKEDALFEEAIYTSLAQQGRLAAYITDHRYYGVGSFERLSTTERFFRRDKTILLDRDGVLNRRPPRARYVSNWSEWEWLPGSLEALRLLKQGGYRIILVSNQPGINRGEVTLSALNDIHDRMISEARAAGGGIDAIYFCPHDWDEGCVCRKPKPGMLLQAQKDFCLDLTRSLFVGDDERDAMAAVAAETPFAPVTDSRSLLDIARQLCGGTQAVGLSKTMLMSTT